MMPEAEELLSDICRFYSEDQWLELSAPSYALLADCQRNLHLEDQYPLLYIYICTSLSLSRSNYVSVGGKHYSTQCFTLSLFQSDSSTSLCGYKVKPLNKGHLGTFKVRGIPYSEVIQYTSVLVRDRTKCPPAVKSSIARPYCSLT